MIGKTISHYKILEKLGEGGMGVVYKAEDTKLKRHVALKFLPTNLTADKEARERFVQEAQAASALDHPNICTIYEINETEDGQMFIAMAYYGGETLKQKVASRQSSVSSTIDIAMQIGKGLAKAHQHGIFHRDIKPANVIVASDGLVKILDFGLAKLAGQARLTRTGTTIGTVAYMSPEQVRGEEVDHRSDIWSLGVVLYEMITGKLPFGGEYEQAILYSIIHEMPNQMAHHVDNVPEDLQRIVDKALEKDRETRYKHVDDLVADLQRERKSPSTSIKPITVKKRISKKAKMVAAIAMVSALITIISFYIFNRKASQTVPATHKQITFTGDANFPTISPDGQFIAYVTGKKSDQKVMVQELTGGQPLEIFSGLEFWTLKWLPNGSELTTNGMLNDSSWGTFFVPRLGGNSRRTRIGIPNSLSPDGARIAAIASHEKNIWFFNMTTFARDTTSILLSGSFDWMFDLDWSPLGKRILILTAGKQGQYTIWTIKTDGSEQQQVVEDSIVLHSPRWSANGDAIYYARSIGQTHDLMKVPVSITTGKAKAQPKILQTGLQMGEYFALSKDNKRLLYTRGSRYANLWLVNLEGTNEGRTAKTKQLTTGTSWIHEPEISPDGRKIAFSIGERPHANIFLMPIEGGAMQQLTYFDSYNTSASWSSNGREITFGSTQGGKPHVWKIDANGGTPHPFEKSELSDDTFDLTWSPGSNILYQQPGNRNFHVLNPLTAEERALVTNDSVGWVFSPRYSPDGKNVAISWNRWEAHKDRGGIWLISLEDSSQRFLLKGNFCPIVRSGDGKWLYAWDPFKKPIKVIMVPINGGNPKTVAILPFENIEMNGISMTHDGKKIVCAVFETQSDVWLMENFDLEVGK